MPGIVSKLLNPFISLYVFTTDFFYCFLNIILPNKRIGSVVPKGHPGFGGEWPEFQPPKEGDSRCSCPAINVMANHGIIPRDGKNVSFKELTTKIRATYNFAPSFCVYVPRFAATYLNKSYASDKFDLADLDLHNTGIEHDASLVRHDHYFTKDQGKIAPDLIEGLLNEATGEGKDGERILTPADLSRYSGKRRAASKLENPEYQLDFGHKMFSSSNASTMLVTLGGRVNDLRIWLLEERFPEKWEPRLRSRMGLTFAAFNLTVFKVEKAVDEKAALAKLSADATVKVPQEA